MNSKLLDPIAEAWKRLMEGAKNRDWQTCQDAYRRLTTLRDLEEQERRLAERIARATTDLRGCNDQINESARDLTPSFENSKKRKIIRPRELRIGEYSEPIAINNQIVVNTANWIIAQGVVPKNVSNFIHSTNSGFAQSAQTKPLVSGQFIEIGDSQETLFKKARKLLDENGFRELKLEVLLENGRLLET